MKLTIPARLSGYGFRLGILLLAITASFAAVFGTPDTVKTALKESGVYSAAVDRVASEQAGEITKDAENNTSVTVNQKEVRDTLAETFTPESVRQSAEQVIDGTYGWLQGKTAQPEFRVDLTPQINKLTATIGDKALHDAEAKPACTLEQLRRMNPQNIDIFNLPCRPPGADLAAARDQAVAELKQSNDFLRDPVLTADNLPSDSKGQNFFEQSDGLPGSYQWGMRAPWIFGGLAIVCAGLVFLFMRNWRESIRRLARSLLVTGIIIAVLAGLTRLLFTWLTKPDGAFAKLADGDFREVALTFVSTLEKAVDSRLFVFGLVYIGIGIIALVVLRFFKPLAEEATARTSSPLVSSNTEDGSFPSDKNQTLR